MAKIVVSLNGAVLKEVKLAKERTSIGRHTHNDIVIDNRAVSGAHAVIVMAGHEVILEDLNSTNGTLVNGQPIKKHFLQDKDVIELAKYKISFYTAPPPRPVVPAVLAQERRTQQEPSRVHVLPERSMFHASIKVLTGANIGKQLVLTKPITTIGRPGVQVTVITQRQEGFFITHVEGEPHPLLNGKTIGGEPQILADGDVIDLAGTRMGFSLTPNMPSKD